MVKLPMSDYVADYYKKQGITFTFRQQACYAGIIIMFLNIKSPFGLGDIVMAPYFESPRIVTTAHDCFEERYERTKDRDYFKPDISDNCIRTDWIGADGNPYYDHTIPFDLWVIDSWEDENYWEILQILSQCAKIDVSIFNLNYYIDKYKEQHCKSDREKG